jgi:hypothetical protein
VTVALNLLYGAAVTLRVHMLRCQGVALDAAAVRARPMEREQIEQRLQATERILA